ncbi:MAG: hypothetical protein K2G87_03235 [Oscillospiraceae bacterium]|nr:hypothetical protein [Oscillospiraceae bacterium]
MNDLKNIFGKLTASDELKNRLYEAAEENVPHEMKKRPVLKKTAAVLVSAAAVLAVSVTTAAVAGFFDLGTVMRNKFDDNISAAKLEEGSYQPLDVSAENDLLSVKALAFIGDYEDCYVILEVRSKQCNDDLKGLFLGVQNYDELCEDTDDFGYTSYMGEPVADENGEQSYIFKVKCYPAFSGPSAENQAKLFFDIKWVGYERGAKNMFSRTPTDLSLGFVPDGSVIREPAEIKLEEPSCSNGVDCTVERFVSTVYATKVDISYPIYKSSYDNVGWSLWDDGRKQGRRLLAIHEGSLELTDEYCPVKLRVDGEYVPLFSGRHAWYPGDVYVDERDGGVGQPYSIYCVEDEDKFLVEVRFEHIDFDGAESIVLEMKNGLDPTREIVIK